MYDPELINAAIGAKRLTNKIVAEKGTVAESIVSAIRNGKTDITLTSLRKVAGAVGFKVAIHFVPEIEQQISVASPK